MKNMIIKKPAKPIPQNNARSSLYSSQLYITYGEVDSVNADGTCNVLLVNGIIAEHIRIPSTTWPTEDPVSGGASKPPKKAKVIILHPQNDINSGLVYPAYLNDKNDKVTEALLDQGNKRILPGGWEYTYDNEKGIATFINGDFNLTVNPDTKEINLTDFNSNTVVMDSSGIAINGDTDYAVAYNDLKTAFDKLKTDLNNLITAYNEHTHTVTTHDTIIGSATATLDQGVASTADMSGAKVDNVKLK